MPVGDITPYASGRAISVLLLDSTSAANGPPSLVTDGLSMQNVADVTGSMPDNCKVELWSTAGSGVMTATGRLWGYSPNSGWSPVGTGPDASKGLLNGGLALGETSADSVKHSELLNNPGHFERLYLELTGVNGTFKSAVTFRMKGR
jgi:hypothetical protein